MSGMIVHAELGLVPAVEFVDRDGAPLYDYPEQPEVGQSIRSVLRHEVRLLIEFLYDVIDEEGGR